jgi:hypothetical protein
LHCEHHFKLDKARKDGSTLRTHYESLAEAGHIDGSVLVGPECPAELDYIVAWFNELHKARGGSGFGPNPINHVGILAWSQLTARRIAPFEVELLLAIDNRFLAVMAAQTDG